MNLSSRITSKATTGRGAAVVSGAAVVVDPVAGAPPVTMEISQCSLPYD